ncbi:MAG: hypothetical protein JEZ14_15375 [Marinilabiliaceae bacterium]|nr:hypothetical protein [Marinilabiliaceae bacterium]
MVKDSIKIGIILDSPVVPLWIYRVVNKIVDSEFAEIKLVVYNTKAGNNPPKISLFYKLHEKLEQFIFRNRIDFSNKASLNQILRGVHETSICNNFTDTCHEISLNRLDIILNFSSFVINDSGLKLSRMGIWNYTIECQNIFEINSNVYWKVVNKSPVIRAFLQCSNGSSGSTTVIHCSWLATNFNSTLLNLDQAFELCALIIPRLIRGIYLYGYEYSNMLAKKYHKTDKDTASTVSPLPSNGQAMMNMSRILVRYLYQRLMVNKQWKWFLMYTFKPSPFPETITSYESLIPPKDRFWADPFVLCRNSKKFIFIEEFPYRKKKGHISLLELDMTGKLVTRNTILEKPYHMSYPFVFEHGNGYYMIPETSENRTVELYKCSVFPLEWSYVMNLMDNINAKDTTLYYYNNKWWLFAAINESSSFSEHAELFLFYSDDVTTTDWTPHPCNPIVTDIRTARPAGRIFTHNNKIYRPSQDCSVRYGRALNINQIITLNETSYKEVLISKTEATWHYRLKGVHTLNFDKDLSVIDVYKF